MRNAIAIYWISSLIVFFAVVFAVDYLGRDWRQPFAPLDSDFILHFAKWDGDRYASVVTNGYDYDPQGDTKIAFFPAFPLVGRAITAIGLPAKTALLLVAHVFLIASFLLLWRYTESEWVLLSFAFWPPTFFFRMAYTESMFFFLALLAMWGIKRHWHPLWVALIVGAATGTRSVGVALLVPLLIYVWQRTSRWRTSIGYMEFRASGWRRAALATALLPLALWGLIAFMVYQHFAFGNALAFAEVQDNFRIRERIDLVPKVVKLLTLEPFWATYSESSDAWWGRLSGKPEADVLFSLRFWNPIYFAAAVGLTFVGWRRRWLNVYEITLAVGLLAIPYVTRGYDFGMCSQARFAAICFPMYIVLGRLLVALPATWRCLLIALGCFFLATYSALFSLGYPLF